MLLILGKTASGKSTTLKEFVNRHSEYVPLILYTTRPKRDGEVEGLDYNFITETEFDSMRTAKEFIDYAVYNGWMYGVAKEDCKKDNAILVATPQILRKLEKNGITCKSVYIDVDRRSRMIVSLLRGSDIDEAYRRDISENDVYVGIEDDVDCVINNDGFNKSIEEILDEIDKFIER